MILRKHLGKFLLFLFISIAIYVIEYKSYLNYTNTWIPLSCLDGNTCTRILLVADPQLIGVGNEVPHLATPLTIWDSDRYIAKTYHYAFKFAKPDVVIFLGDLFDEGSMASDLEFRNYVRRLFNIFLVGASANVRHIWLPGDNDIGGEGNDAITEHKFKRYFHAFSQPDIVTIKNIDFYKINRLMHSIPKISDNKDFFTTDKLTVGLSHIPLLFIPALFVDKVLTKMQPQLLFTAHEHKSMIISANALIRNDRQIVPVVPSTNQVFEYSLGVNDIYEIIVPTCSYRMGTDKIGFGFAVIENAQLQYTVLWSPPRFPQLIVLGVVFLTVIFSVVVWCFKCRKRF